jgi:hypothetical protein
LRTQNQNKEALSSVTKSCDSSAPPAMDGAM